MSPFYAAAAAILLLLKSAAGFTLPRIMVSDFERIPKITTYAQLGKYIPLLFCVRWALSVSAPSVNEDEHGRRL